MKIAKTDPELTMVLGLLSIGSSDQNGRPTTGSVGQKDREAARTDSAALGFAKGELSSV